MYKKIRIALAAVFFTCISLLLAGVGEHWFGWMPKLQFLPSLLALNFLSVILIIALTFLIGRLYCSVICPLGVYQDIVIWIRKKIGGKKFKYKYHKEFKVLRYGVWGLFIIAIIAGIQVFVAILAPYSAYGRMVNSIVAPHSWVVVLIAALTFIIVTTMAAMGGREYCNSVCPVGTTLGFISRFAIFRPMIDTGMCVSCGGCERNCKSHCIDSKNKTVDHSRCVACFSCIDHCKLHGLKLKNAYSSKSNEPAASANNCSVKGDDGKKAAQCSDQGRRAFISGAIMAGTAATIKAQVAEFDGGLVAVKAKEVPQRTERLVPFGAKSLKSFYDHCTACQLCITNCPNHVLRPSTDLKHLMQPQMGYENGYCRPECTLCSQLCPAGAIEPITPEEKTAIHIGCATVNFDLCVTKDYISCGNCARHCPAGAIMMVSSDPSDRLAPRIPVVDETKCIGCGACENLCPSRPISAITVNGYQVHMNN